MTAEQMRRYAEEMCRYRPALLRGYSSSLFTFAKFIEENKLEIISPKAITTTADMLTENMRRFIENVFSARVYNQYACGEVEGGAHECELHNGLHIAEEHNIYEVEAPEGEEGNLLITDLDNFGMPFIRYKNGDTAVLTNSPCPCGRPTKRVSRIGGRMEESITLQDGRVLNTTFFSPFFTRHEVVRQYQIVQKGPDSLEIRVSADDNSSARLTMEKELRIMLGGEVDLVFSYHKTIPLEPGKEKLKVILRADTVQI